MIKSFVAERNILSKSENIVLYIIRCCTKKYGCLSRSIRWIAEKVKISYRHAVKVIKKLFEEGLIAKLECPGKINHYIATDVKPRKREKNFRNFKKNTVHNPVHNPGISEVEKEKNTQGSSHIIPGEKSPDIHYRNNLPSEDIDKSSNGTSPENSSKEKTEKETWRESIGYRILSRCVGTVTQYFDIPALQRLYTLCEADAHEIAYQFAYVKQKCKGHIPNPSGLITRLVATFLSKKRTNTQEIPKSSQKASELEIRLSLNMDRLEEYQLVADQEEDGYCLISNTGWRYHVLGKKIVFRDLKTDKVVEFNAISKTFIEDTNNFFEKIYVKSM